jgi:hypothetical protein
MKRKWIIRKETLASFIFLLGSIYIMALIQVWTDEVNPGYDKILPDIGFMTLPHLKNEWISDVYIHSLLIIVIIRIIFTKYKEVAFRRFFWITGLLYLFRSFTISFTILPTPYHGCTLQKHENPLLIALKVISAQHSTCGDVMYSGHTMILTTSALLWQLYTNDHIIIKILIWLLSFIGMLIIISTHFHYSDDVIIAFLLTLALYIIYHWALWIGEVHRFGGNTPFSIIGEIILTIDGTDYIDKVIKKTEIDNINVNKYFSNNCNGYQFDFNEFNAISNATNNYNPCINNNNYNIIKNSQLDININNIHNDSFNENLEKNINENDLEIPYL